ncbi:MAG TPA: hypothetical protein VI357_24210 [Mycobacteriales bacterium]
MEDLFSRRLLGFAMSGHDAELPVASLRMDAAVRGGSVCGVIFHTDQVSDNRHRRLAGRRTATQSRLAERAGAGAGGS